MPSPLVMRQLAFVRYVYGLAVSQSYQPGELGAVSVLHFHDSVELFLQLVATETGSNTSDKTTFIQYFDEVEKSPSHLVLGQRQAMLSMNKARVAFKHGSNLPSQTTIENIRANVRSFFEENARLVFRIEFETVSLLDLVPYSRCKMHLQRAADLLGTGDHYTATGEAHIAFIELLSEFGDAVRDEFHRLPYFARHSFAEKHTTGMYPAIDNEVRRENALMKVVSELTEAMQVVTLGIEYRKYARFIRRKPMIGGRQENGEYYLFPKQDSQKDVPREYARFCYDFVIEAAIGLQSSEREITSSATSRTE